MIQNSFIHWNGITTEIERTFWKLGISEWSKYPVLKNKLIGFENYFSIWDEEYKESFNALSEGNWKYFANKLNASDLWRIYPEFQSEFLFLDIETNGLGEKNFITCLTLATVSSHKTFIRGKDLEFFWDHFPQNKILVTYNGIRFDLPFVEREFSMKFQGYHLDLMHVLHGMNIKGGLKGSEIQLGIVREKSQGIDGRMAVQLWYRYVESDDEDSLQLLTDYNQEDTINLITVLNVILERKKKVLENLMV
jgi:uncharacterized protein YprB with RNaseH-like and TPR domain